MGGLAGKDAYVQAGFMGLGLFLAGLLTIFVAILIYDVAEVYFLFFFLVPGLIVAAALFFWRRWGLLVAILGSVIGILFLSEDADLILTTPKAFFDFAATWFGIIGLLIVLVAAIAGTVQYVRKQPSQTLAPWQSKLILGVAAVLAVAGVISLVAMIANTGSVSEAEAGDAPEVTAKHTKWSVEMITAPAGDVRIVVKNDDPLLHTFTIKDLDIDVALGPWSEEVIVLEDVTPGNYGFICRVFDHDTDMTGVITVQ